MSKNFSAGSMLTTAESVNLESLLRRNPPGLSGGLRAIGQQGYFAAS